MNMDEALPLIFMSVMGLAMLIYVILDGYDLGVGILLPWASDADKDMMVASIGPFWDANETWLVLGVGVLLIAFPQAHGIILTALYLPVALMLLGLTLRGVAFDFRVKAKDRHRGLWNAAFSAGSWIAAVSQGWMLGAYITGFRDDALATLFSLGIAFTLPAAYVLLGSGWLVMKTEGNLQALAVKWGRRALWPMMIALVAISVATPLVSPTVFEKWFGFPQLFALAPIPLACAVALATLWHVFNRPRIIAAGYGWLIFAAMVLICVMATIGLAYSMYPYIVMDRLTVWQAASSPDALKIILFGVAITLPAILGYTVFVYRIFWGKATELRY
ncbi:MAG: cytochrome d ubiquinol oxidase subunit II [Burkholderiales bacterium]|nr:cytochrome d ubiquinol oxidase subunit II [Burkholderiales bacterium]